MKKLCRCLAKPGMRWSSTRIAHPRFKVSSTSCKSHSYKQACGGSSVGQTTLAYIIMCRLLQKIDDAQ